MQELQSNVSAITSGGFFQKSLLLIFERGSRRRQKLHSLSAIVWKVRIAKYEMKAEIRKLLEPFECCGG